MFPIVLKWLCVCIMGTLIDSICLRRAWISAKFYWEWSKWSLKEICELEIFGVSFSFLHKLLDLATLETWHCCGIIIVSSLLNPLITLQDAPGYAPGTQKKVSGEVIRWNDVSGPEKIDAVKYIELLEAEIEELNQQIGGTTNGQNELLEFLKTLEPQNIKVRMSCHFSSFSLRCLICYFDLWFSVKCSASHTSLIFVCFHEWLHVIVTLCHCFLDRLTFFCSSAFFKLSPSIHKICRSWPILRVKTLSLLWTPL